MAKKLLTEPFHERSNGAIHEWFGLTYSHYLVLPRALLQEMPTEWQSRFINCIEEIRDYFDCSQLHDDYMVKLRGEKGQFITDPLSNYRYPNRDYIDRMKRIPEPKEDHAKT